MVWALVEKRPIHRSIGIPLPALSDFAPHKEQLFSGEKPLITQEHAQIGKLLPVITSHSPDQRSLSMDDLIVRKRQNKILMMMVEHRESQIILVVLSIDRIAAKVLQSVVHP